MNLLSTFYFFKLNRLFLFYVLLSFTGSGFASQAVSFSSEQHLRVETAFSPISKSDKIKVTVNTNEGIIRIVISETRKEVGSLELINELGEVVYSAEVRLWDGTSVIDLEIADFEKGTFEIRLKTTEGTFQSKFTRI